MDMNKAFFLKKEEHKPNWRLIDAAGQTMGRLATRISDILRGKDSAFFTNHTDSGDYVVVINAEKVVLTGNKLRDKQYIRMTGYIGNRKEFTAKQMFEKHPTEPLMLAVKRMLPRNKLSRQIITKLKLYAGSEHPHKAQIK
jgi:large subunit ribosomal protein L13